MGTYNVLVTSIGDSKQFSPKVNISKSLIGVCRGLRTGLRYALDEPPTS